ETASRTAYSAPFGERFCARAMSDGEASKPATRMSGFPPMRRVKPPSPQAMSSRRAGLPAEALAKAGESRRSAPGKTTASWNVSPVSRWRAYHFETPSQLVFGPRRWSCGFRPFPCIWCERSMPRRIVEMTSENQHLFPSLGLQPEAVLYGVDKVATFGYPPAT